jgi:signal transduction histidine kinase
MVNPSGRLIAANDHAARLLGIASDGEPEITLREITDLSRAEFNSLLQLCLATTTPVPLRLSFYPAIGRPLSLRCEGWRCLLRGEASVIVRIFDEAEVSSRFSELTLMINQLNEACMVHRQSEGRLRAALAHLHHIDSIRDHMLAQVSHDLRTPLNAILGMTEFMQTQPFGPLAGKYSEYVEDIHTSGDTLLQLVDQVLHLAWVDAHSDVSTCDTLADLGECLENCCRVVEPIIRMRGLQIVVPRFVLKPRLRADQLLVTQILINLLGNAAKYAAKGGNIEIKVTWRKGRTLAIQIKDDGPGIS